CVLVDIGLPGMDGYEVAKRLRSRDGNGRTLLIALTGYGQQEDRARSRQAGFDHHLVKPVAQNVLEDVLRAR
ncbi:MAG: response regulator, partial [Burkholderiales bacterium]